MLLQSLTPLRSLMSPVPSEGVKDIQTPLALRAALGMTPLVENGARLKTHSTASRRPSVDPLQRCKGELQRILFSIIIIILIRYRSNYFHFLIRGASFQWTQRSRESRF
jgi:hypothetical protein